MPWYSAQDSADALRAGRRFAILVCCPRRGDTRVRVYPGTDGEVRGTVVEDFGDLAGHAVDIGENHMVGPARRWAVALDAGGLVFVDSDQLAAEWFYLSRFTHRRATVFSSCGGAIGHWGASQRAEPRIAL